MTEDVVDYWRSVCMAVYMRLSKLSYTNK